jgi:hypothetical protein
MQKNSLHQCAISVDGVAVTDIGLALDKIQYAYSKMKKIHESRLS